jgi:2,5-diamino-6-(ribosylamino)-4(3H)-pyrimidinone 5'-phosphate reductase
MPTQSYVTINMAVTLDGRVIRPGGRWYGLTSRNDRKRMDEIRLLSQALIIGTNTIITDNPVVWNVHEDGSKNPDSPIPVMMCRSRLPPVSSRIFESVHRPLIFVNEQLFSENDGKYDENIYNNAAELILLPEDEIIPEVVLTHLRAKGIYRVLIEGGPSLNHAFIEKNLINRIYLTIVPYIIGGSEGSGIVTGRTSLPDFDRKNWILEESRSVENEVYLIYNRS